MTNLNNLEEQIHNANEKKDISKLVSLQPAYKFNAGGHINHSILWQVSEPTSMCEIYRTF